MIKLLLPLIALSISSSVSANEVEDASSYTVAQNQKRTVKRTVKKKTKKTTTAPSSSATSSSATKSEAPRQKTKVVKTKRTSEANLVSRIKNLASSGQYEEASKLLFGLSRNPQNAREAAQLKYMLGLMLMELKLNQVASFVFYDVIDEEIRRKTDGRYLKQSLSKLSYLSNILDSDVLLKYAVSRIQVADFPAESRDLFFYRLGELKYKEGSFAEAARSFSKVEAESLAYPQALYKRGLAYAEEGKLGNAIASFEELLSISQNKPVTDPNRVNAAMALARIYYQGKKWDKAITYYRMIPRDTIQWHDSLFEMSWAMMRSGQHFRSALSNFHTLHSPYYEENYAPESLLLRSIVYLYICRYDEMEKVLDLFDRIYKPVMNNVDKMLSRSENSRVYWDEIKKGMERQASDVKDEKGFQRLNDMVVTALLKQNQIKSNVSYYKKLMEEEKLISKMSREWQLSGIGKFSKRIVDRRKSSTEDLVGKLARNHLLKMKSELRDFFEQGDFLKFEMVSGQKEVKGKEIVGKKVRKQITDEASRNFFISNGFEYWPFQGEYWLDELGNYHYVGVQACE